MTTYLDIINQARRHFGKAPIDAISAASNTNPEQNQYMAALQYAAREIITKSEDWQWNEVFKDYSSVSGESELTQTAADQTASPWDIDGIHSLKYINSNGEEEYEIYPVGTERGKSMLTNFTAGQPLFFFVNKSKLYLIPEPNAAYTIRVYFQNILPTIDANNISATIPMSSFVEHALLDGTRLFFRRDKEDPNWKVDLPDFEQKVERAIQHNKKAAKEKGAMQMIYQSPIYDRNYG